MFTRHALTVALLLGWGWNGSVASAGSPSERGERHLPESLPVAASQDPDDEAACDSHSFLAYAEQAEELRSDRKISAAEFAQMANEENTIVLDARDPDAYRALHIRGSVNLPYTSFSETALRENIPSKTTRILIYCRNNLRDAPSKNAPKSESGSRHPYPSEDENLKPAKDVAAGLNIPTYITLYVYGYTNVWELNSIVDVNHTPLQFVSSTVTATVNTQANTISLPPLPRMRTH